MEFSFIVLDSVFAAHFPHTISLANCCQNSGFVSPSLFNYPILKPMQTPLHQASTRDGRKVVELLLQWGAYKTIVDRARRVLNRLFLSFDELD